MGVEFRWYSGETEVVPPPPEQPRLNRRLGRWLLSLGLVSLIVAGGLSWRARRGLRAVRADLQRLVDQEILALQTGQRDSFLALLDTRYAPWLRYHQQNFERQAAWYAAHPGLRAHIESVNLGPDLAVAQVRLLDRGGAQSRPSTWFFRRVGGHWRHAPPTSAFAGPTTRIETRHLILIAQRPDRELAAHLAPELEALWLRLAESYQGITQAAGGTSGQAAAASARIVVRIFPYGNNAASTSTISSPQLGLDMWTTAERSALAGRDARVVVARAVLNRLLERSQPRPEDWWLLEGLALWHAQAWQPEWRAAVQESLADGSFRRLFSAESYSLGSAWQRQALPSDLEWARPLAYTLGEFLGATCPSERLCALLRAMRSRASSRAAVEAALGLSPAELEAAWEDYLRQHYRDH